MESNLVCQSIQQKHQQALKGNGQYGSVSQCSGGDDIDGRGIQSCNQKNIVGRPVYTSVVHFLNYRAQLYTND